MMRICQVTEESDRSITINRRVETMEALQEYFPRNVHTWQYANTLIIEYDQLRLDYFCMDWKVGLGILKF